MDDIIPVDANGDGTLSYADLADSTICGGIDGCGSFVKRSRWGQHVDFHERIMRLEK
jgi:hypothetical protein